MLTQTLTFIVAWYNLPFTIMLGLCVLASVLQLIGLDHDADVDADVDADFDFDADVDADVDIDADADLDADGDVDADDIPGALALLAFLGVGKAPLLVVMVILLGSIGAIGWTLNSVVQSAFDNNYPAWGLTAVFPLALIAGSFISSRTARAIGRALPSVSTTATAAVGLIGRRGTVISPRVDEKYGLVRVRDDGGTLINVFAISHNAETISGHSEVALVDYDAEKKLYTVAPIQPKSS